MGAMVASFIGAIGIFYYMNAPWYLYIISTALLLPSVVRNNEPYLAFNFRCIIPFLFGIYSLILAVKLSESPVSYSYIEWLSNAYTHNENFFSVLSTLYAVFTALILVKAIEDFERLHNTIQYEAGKISSIIQFLMYFETNINGNNKISIRNIKILFLKYMDEISKTSGHGSEGNISVLNGCVREVSNLECEDNNDEISLSQIMSALDALFMIRSKRICYMHSRLSPYLLSAVAFMSISIMVPFYLKSEDGPSGNYYIIFILGTGFCFLFMMLLDIGSPLKGIWKVGIEAFDEVRAAIASDVEAPGAGASEDVVMKHDVAPDRPQEAGQG